MEQSSSQELNVIRESTSQITDEQKKSQAASVAMDCDQEPYYELITSGSRNEVGFSSLSGSGTGSSQPASEGQGEATLPSSNLACGDQINDKGALSSLSFSVGNIRASSQQGRFSTMSSVSSINEVGDNDGFVVDKVPGEDLKADSDGASDTSSTRAVKLLKTNQARGKKRSLSGTSSPSPPAVKKDNRRKKWNALMKRRPQFDSSKGVTGRFVELLDTSVLG
jgi:hypothetical protein